jgi:hypothetical protein
MYFGRGKVKVIKMTRNSKVISIASVVSILFVILAACIKENIPFHNNLSTEQSIGDKLLKEKKVIEKSIKNSQQNMLKSRTTTTFYGIIS